MKNLLPKLFCYLLILLFYPSSTFAFVDNFDSEASLYNYVVNTNSGSVSVSSGKLILSAPSSSKQFPYVLLKSHLVGSQATNISIDFKYFSVGVFGAGIILDDNYPSNGSYYDVGSNSIAWTWNWGAPPKVRVGRYPFLITEMDNQTGEHNLRVYGAPGLYEVYLDGVLIGTTNSTKKISSLWFGNPDVVDSTHSWPVIEIDRVVIDEHQSMFPYYSQRDPMWKDLPYDSASVWAGAKASTIERWGCAITSVAMVLKEYNIKMPNGEEARPDKINAWLLTQPDGYVGSGLLNWLAISRLVHDARSNGHSDTDLEFVKSYESPTGELDNNLHPIVDEGGHFVVVYDQNNESYLINDPNDESRTTKLKSESIRSVNSYIPSSTDLSYILLVSEEKTELVTKYLGNNIGETYLEEITDDLGDSSTGKYNVTYIAKPSAGEYRLHVNNQNLADSKVKIYSYDANGKVEVMEQNVPAGKSDWVLDYYTDGTNPIITELDTKPPTYVGTNSFSGWYNTPQTATFNFVDPNLPSGFVSPTCVISTEGRAQTCSMSAVVCDTSNNCNTFELTSNPANLDFTPPKGIKKIWSIGMRPYSLVSWLPSRDGVRYLVEWGTDKTFLTNKLHSYNHWIWIPTPRVKEVYLRITAEDRAGNQSEPSKVEKTLVHPRYWKW